MGLGRLWTGAVLAGFLLGVSYPARAYTPQALAQFNAGRQFQAAKQWSQAAAAYNAALKADPTLTAAYKSLGTVYYQAGDRKGALYFYDRYLTYYPTDTATKAFADRLRASVAGPAAPQAQSQTATGTQAAGAAPVQAGAAAETTPPPFKQRWAVSVNGAYNTYSFTDWNSTYGPGSAAAALALAQGYAVTGSTINNGYSFGGSIDYYCLRNLMLALDVDYFLAGSSLSQSGVIDGANETATLKFNFPVIWAGPSAYVVFPGLIPHCNLRFGGGAGYLFLIGASGTYDVTATEGGASGSDNATSTMSGSALGAKLDAGLDWFFNAGYSLGIDVGYRMASIPKVTESPAYISSDYGGNGTLLQANGSDLPFDYSGLYIKASIANWF
jgi:hypothetical protein